MHKSYIKVIYDMFIFRICVEPKKEAEVISEILLKAASEPEFRNSMIRDPANVLETYNISPRAKTIIAKSISDLTK